MKEMALFYAQFNKEKDNEIIEIVRNMPEEEVYKQRTISCGTIFNLFCHIIIGSWHHQANMKRILGMDYAPYFPLDQVKTLDCSLEESFTWLQAIDNDFIDFCRQLKEADFKKELHNCRIKAINRTIDETLYHIFTLCIVHQVHHRGQLSQLFKELGIKQSLGDVWPYIPDSLV
jgi:uncharacterized damage-inducible protein DinB